MYGASLLCKDDVFRQRMLCRMRLLKDMKKDYYLAFPSTNLYLEIRDLVISIRSLEKKLK